jgi:uridine kinase
LTRHAQDGTRSVIVIEGFLLFFFPQVASACHHRIMFRCSEAVCCRRRLQRTYSSLQGSSDPVEVDAEEVDEFTAWYHNTVWKHFIK